jgi:hypothetical protein
MRETLEREKLESCDHSLLAIDGRLLRIKKTLRLGFGGRAITDQVSFGVSCGFVKLP